MSHVCFRQALFDREGVHCSGVDRSRDWEDVPHVRFEKLRAEREEVRDALVRRTVQMQHDEEDGLFSANKHTCKHALNPLSSDELVKHLVM